MLRGIAMDCAQAICPMAQLSSTAANPRKRKFVCK